MGVASHSAVCGELCPRTVHGSGSRLERVKFSVRVCRISDCLPDLYGRRWIRDRIGDGELLTGSNTFREVGVPSVASYIVSCVHMGTWGRGWQATLEACCYWSDPGLGEPFLGRLILTYPTIRRRFLFDRQLLDRKTW
jgi:hypothetical protein